MKNDFCNLSPLSQHKNYGAYGFCNVILFFLCTKNIFISDGPFKEGFVYRVWRKHMNGRWTLKKLKQIETTSENKRQGERKGLMLLKDLGKMSLKGYFDAESRYWKGELFKSF